MQHFKKNGKLIWISLFIAAAGFLAFMLPASNQLKISKGTHIMLIGNNLGSRMIEADFFETEMQLRYADSMLYIRNMCDGGNTPGFRPHSGRNTPWAFPGAEKFQTELAKPADMEGFVEYPDEWLSKHQADIIIAFFGYNESFQGAPGLANYKAELDAFIKHTLAQRYNGRSAPQLALVSPIAFENLSGKYDLPNGVAENANLKMYTLAMKEVAAKNKVLFIDAFTASKPWLDDPSSELTIDGAQLTNAGYARFGPFLADEIFGKKNSTSKHREAVYGAVMEKNWMWHNDYKIRSGQTITQQNKRKSGR
ncbi:MAG: hypothetical protein RLZZ172_2028 [Bacteroidota bacterium]|jgi:hypothetical protein